jgi:hypothetical protein
MLDFEKAAINAFQETFTTTTNTVKISGCFFHLQKSILRKVQVSNNLRKIYLFFCIQYMSLGLKLIMKMIQNSLMLLTKSVH